MPNNKYFIYCRKSSEEDSRQAQSLETQQRLLIDLANKHDLKVVDIIKESRSAKTDNNRPLFTQMLKRVSNGDANGILVIHTDRLARNFIDAGFIIKMIESETLQEVRTLTTTFDNAPSLLYMGFDFVFAAHYSRDLSTKVKQGNESKLLKGEYPTYAPIGYINITPGDGIKPDPIRAQHISNAFNYFASGDYSVKTLAKKMFLEGLRSRNGKRISPSSLHRILTNPEYYGVIRRKGKIYKGKHTPLVSKNTFDSVQDVISGRSRPRKQTRKFTYRDYLVCDRCGCKITAGISKGKYIYYRCTNGKGNCDQHKKYLREKDVKKIMSQFFAEFTLDPKLANASFDLYKQSMLQKEKQKHNSNQELKKHISSLDKRLEKLEDMYLEERISPPRYDERRAGLMQERADLQVFMEQQSLISAKTTLELVENVKNQAIRLNEVFENGDDKVRRDLVKSVLWNCNILDGRLVSTRLTKLWKPLQGLNKTTDLEKWRGE